MRPLRLHMQGFGAFRQAIDVDFTDIELLALVGATGSGKSTIIDAITFALYGSVARYDDARVVAPVINQMENEARVSLDFELTGEPFTATRVVRRTTAGGATTKEARLEQGSDVLAADARTMSARVEELLGLDVAQFNRTVVLPQGRFADFIHDSPADRQATLRQLLGLEMYKRMGAAARSTAAQLRGQAAMLQDDFDADVTTLTDQRRDELVARIDVIGTAREVVTLARTRLDELTSSTATVETSLAEVVAREALVADLRAPDGVDEIDATVAAATAARKVAADQLTSAREARRAAADAVASGPDASTIKLQLQRHADAEQASVDHERWTAEVARATDALTSASAAAEVVVAEQTRLDDLLARARGDEEAARAALTELPSTGQIDMWIQLHERLAAASHDVANAEAALSASEERLHLAEGAVTDADVAATAAQAQRDDLRQRAGAVGLLELLAVGEPCPLCLQEVRELPEHHIGDDLAIAERGCAQAAARLDEASRKRDSARSDHARAEARLHSGRNALAAATRDLDGVASVEVLTEQRTEAQRRAAQVEQAVAATRQAATEAQAHRDAPEHQQTVKAADLARDDLTRATTSEQGAARQLAALTERLEGVAPADNLLQQLATAERLHAEQKATDATCTRAEAADEEAVQALDRANDLLQHANADLHAARDRVAAMGPPAIGRTPVATAWLTLTEWADQQRDDLHHRHDVLDSERRELQRQRSDLEGAIRHKAAEALGRDDTSSLSAAQVADLLIRREAEAEGELTSFDQRRVKHEQLGARIAGFAEQASVAETLGGLLRADGFEGWLMRAALQHLVENASVRLMELSGGQYSLELDDRTFAVRDHANADELRGARTLSGGETFLASLSLALALSEATAELAPEGAPQIDSIFLDEGFGTLDTDTLDTVAAAIEELGASGRMVAIVTHIRELADRMPVRLEVTKVGGSSTVTRVEA